MNHSAAWQGSSTAPSNAGQHTVVETALGWHGVVVRDGQVIRLNPPAESLEVATTSLCYKPDSRIEESNRSLLQCVEQQLNEYSGGRRLTFDIPMVLEGTAFQLTVWGHLMTIPAGWTATYKSIATSVGNARAARAVGAAVSANPIAIMIPCHRVIRSDGSIGGYAGGVWVKALLLELEHVHLESC